MSTIIQKAKIRAYEMLNDTIDYLIEHYNTDVRSFGYSSVFGQILTVLQNHVTNILYYIQDSIAQTNFHTATRPSAVYGLARLQGHNANRGVSATGAVILQWKSTATPPDGGLIHIPNYSRMLCLTNGLQYHCTLDYDYKTIKYGHNDIIIGIKEGRTESQTFTGTGEDLQSYEVTSNQFQIFDHDSVIVSVNGVVYDQYDSLYDIPYGSAGCLVKTGITSGIDVIFGKSNHVVPPLGSTITVEYVISSGNIGNIIGAIPVYKFQEDGIDGLGNVVALSDYFDILDYHAPNFGSNPEDINLTKILAPNISRNMILHDSNSIEYYFKKQNYYSGIKVFKNRINNINEYSVLLIPNIINRLNNGEDYFSGDINKFLLSDSECTRIKDHINNIGISSTAISINIVSPIVRYYCMNIYIEAKYISNGKVTNEHALRTEIRSSLHQYLSSRHRINKIPHSDIVALLDDINGVDTVKVMFSGKDNSDIDQYGNINLSDGHYAMIRGGWTDHNGIYYKDEYDPDGAELGSVNVEIVMS